MAECAEDSAMEPELILDTVKVEPDSKDSLCRLCACSSELLIPIFEGEGTEYGLSDKIEKYLPIQVTSQDDLPLQVCFHCASTMLSWHELITSCVDAEHKLKDLFCESISEAPMSPAASRDFDADICEDIGPDTTDLENSGFSSPNTSSIFKENSEQIQEIGDSKMSTAEPQRGETERFQSRGKLSFSEYHASRKSPFAFGFPNQPLESSPLAPFPGAFPCTPKEEIAAASQARTYQNLYRDNSSSTSSDSSDSSDDSYVPPKKLRALASRKQTRQSRTKKEEPSRKSAEHRCLMCSKRFKRPCDLSRHVTIEHSGIKSEPEDEQLEDSVCEEESSTNNETREEAASPSNIDVLTKEKTKQGSQVTCNNCDRKFRTKEALQRHVTGDRCILNPTLNPGSPINFNVAEDGNDHVEPCSTEAGTAEGQGADSVNIKEEDDFDDLKDSDYSVSSEESYKKEKKARPGPSKEKPIYKCDVCNKQFKLKESYTTHTRIHTGEKPFTCHMCGKQFSHSGGLSYHLRHVHMGIKEHPCDICGRKFALKAAMQDHRRIHTGERPYVCDVCGKSFKSKASLYIHSKTHTDQYPHPCEYCSKKFRWRQQLLGHLTTHTGEKKHHCKICNKGFGVRNDLTRHERIHSGQKPFKCSVCGLAFGQKRYLKNHLKSRHGILRMENVEATNE